VISLSCSLISRMITRTASLALVTTSACTLLDVARGDGHRFGLPAQRGGRPDRVGQHALPLHMDRQLSVRRFEARLLALLPGNVGLRVCLLPSDLECGVGLPVAALERGDDANNADRPRHRAGDDRRNPLPCHLGMITAQSGRLTHDTPGRATSGWAERSSALNLRTDREVVHQSVTSSVLETVESSPRRADLALVELLTKLA
jgi:hypothetical protein